MDILIRHVPEFLFYDTKKLAANQRSTTSALIKQYFAELNNLCPLPDLPPTPGSKNFLVRDCDPSVHAAITTYAKQQSTTRNNIYLRTLYAGTLLSPAPKPAPRKRATIRRLPPEYNKALGLFAEKTNISKNKLLNNYLDSAAAIVRAGGNIPGDPNKGEARLHIYNIDPKTHWSLVHYAWREGEQGADIPLEYILIRAIRAGLTQTMKEVNNAAPQTDPDPQDPR